MNRGVCWASDALLMHTSFSHSGAHLHRRGSSTSVNVAVSCAQMRSHLSLARLLLPLPAALDHPHFQHQHTSHHLQHHQQDPFSSPEDDPHPSDVKQKFSTNVVLLTGEDSGGCPFQILSSVGRGPKVLSFAWSVATSSQSSAAGNQSASLPPMIELHASPSSPPLSNSLPSFPLITVHRMTSPLSSALSPPFFQIYKPLQLPPYPVHRHVTLLPPCASTQVQLSPAFQLPPPSPPQPCFPFLPFFTVLFSFFINT